MNKYTFFYTKRRIATDGVDKYEVIKVATTGSISQAERQAKTIATQLGTVLAGGFFNDVSTPCDLNDTYVVVDCPLDTPETQDPVVLDEPRKHFFKRVDLRSRAAMVSFLENHFRYNTMNSWNNSTSYANNMKVHKVIPHSLQDKAYEIINQGEVYDSIREELNVWAQTHDYKYQVQWNGRSGGYLVIVNGGYTEKPVVPTDFKPGGRAYSDRLGRWVEYSEALKKGLLNKTYKDVFSWPGKSIDMHEDFSQWSIDDLRTRVKLVSEFDRLCDLVVDIVLGYCSEYLVKEKVVMVPKTVNVLEKAA